MVSSQTWRYPALLPFSWIYGGIVRLRTWAYERNLFKSVRLPATVVSVGNLAVGGTGKTPTVALLANALSARNFRVAIVARGYLRQGKGACVVSDGRGSLADLKDAGDEPLLLAHKCPQAPIVVARSKTAAAQLAMEEFHPEIILVDDGLQHRRLQRDCDLVLLPAPHLSPPAWLLPAGPLREPWSSLQRAHWVTVSEVGKLSRDEQESMFRTIRGRTKAQVISMDSVADRLEQLWGERSLAKEQLQHAAVFLVSGIANPQRLQRMALHLGAIRAGALAYRDHHAFTRKDAETITRQFQASGAELLITTAKDGIKLRQFEMLQGLPIYILEIRVEIAPADFAALLSFIEKLHQGRHN